MAVTAVALRPDGKELAVSGYHEIQIWDPAEGKLLRRIGNVEERVYSLAYKADGSVLEFLLSPVRKVVHEAGREP